MFFTLNRYTLQLNMLWNLEMAPSFFSQCQLDVVVLQGGSQPANCFPVCRLYAVAMRT